MEQKEEFTKVRQKPNHCVPACLESIATDRGIKITQEEIVFRYSEVFPDDGRINDIGKDKNLETVIKEIGLADNIYSIPYNSVTELDKLSKSNDILILWKNGFKHCVRFCGFVENNTKVSIMDPEYEELQYNPVSWLNKDSHQLIFFYKS